MELLSVNYRVVGNTWHAFEFLEHLLIKRMAMHALMVAHQSREIFLQKERKVTDTEAQQCLHFMSMRITNQATAETAEHKIER